MNDSGSLHIITTELSQINNYDVEFNSDTILYDSHLKYFIKFIFTDRRLCELFGKYSQKNYERMSEIEFIYPLVRYGFVIVIGISENLLIYIPQKLDSKQYVDLDLLLNKYNADNMIVHFSKLNEKGELESKNKPMTISKAINYINNPSRIDSIRKIKKP